MVEQLMKIVLDKIDVSLKRKIFNKNNKMLSLDSAAWSCTCSRTELWPPVPDAASSSAFLIPSHVTSLEGKLILECLFLLLKLRNMFLKSFVKLFDA